MVGKSLMIKKLLQYRDQLFQSKFDRIIFALPETAKDLQVKKNKLFAKWTFGGLFVCFRQCTTLKAFGRFFLSSKSGEAFLR